MQVKLLEEKQVAQLMISKAWRLDELVLGFQGKGNATGEISAAIRAAIEQGPPPPPPGMLLALDNRGRWRDNVLITPGALVKYWSGDPNKFDAKKPDGVGRFAYAFVQADGTCDCYITTAGSMVQAYQTELAFDPRCFAFKQAKAAQLARLLEVAEAHPNAIWQISERDRSSTRQVCRFFTSPRGCRLGDQCHFLHKTK